MSQFTNNNQQYSDEKTFSSEAQDCDDCPICQYVKKVESAGEDQTMEGLQEAFEQARKKGAMVMTDFDIDKP